MSVLLCERGQLPQFTTSTPTSQALSIYAGSEITATAVSSSESVAAIDVKGKGYWLKTVRFPIFDSNGAVSSICAQSSDVTQSYVAEEQRRLAATVFESAGEGILVTDANAKILMVNRAFQEITGYHFSDVVGLNPSILKSDRHTHEFFELMWQSLQTNGAWQGEIFNQRKGGEVYPEWLTISAVKNEAGTILNYVSIFSDITVIKSSQQRIEYLATHDELTGIPNRGLLMDRLSHHISQARRQKTKLAVLFIDLDNFKSINDSLGHDVGDLLLKEASDRLQKCLRESDTLARIGGDEFVVILYDIELPIVNMIAGRIVDFLAASFNIESQNMFVSASVGVSVFPDNGDDSVTLLKNADTAMYRAKDRGRNQFQFFTDEMKVIALQRMTLESGIRVALDSGYLHMHYQPQIAIDGGSIVGAEALVRWSDPNMGQVPPDKFIPIAEECGLIGKVGEAVFKMVLRDVAKWNALGLGVHRVAINMSPHQLRDHTIVEKIQLWLADTGVTPQQICLEITESALMDQLETVGGILRQLEMMGFALSLDDFGTGYSSLSYLRKLPIHELKVDRSFVDGIASNPDDYSITQAVVNMAHALGQKVVAEGVETKEQLDVLKALGCEVAQGYLFYKPMAASEFEQVLRRQAI
jgi:two-component system CheB/CheR fusion protein